MKFYEDKTYIEMCRASSEIQGIWQEMCKPQPPENNFFWNDHFVKGYAGSCYLDEEGQVNFVDYEYESQSINGNTDVWLPYQHQIQEMLIDYAKKNTTEWGENVFNLIAGSPITIFSLFDRFTIRNNAVRYYFSLKGRTCFEIAWLSFAIEYIYNKTWDGKAWVGKEN